MKRRILIVSDNELDREVLSELFRGEFELAVAETGEIALERMRDFGADLVLLDILLPGIDGHEVCRRIKSAPHGELTLVALVSSRGSTEQRLEGYAAGADDYFVRPFNHDELIAKVNTLFRLRGAQMELARANSEIQMYNVEIKALNDELEKIVEQRTAELRRTNESLCDEIVLRKRAEREREEHARTLEERNRDLEAQKDNLEVHRDEVEALNAHLAQANAAAAAATQAKSEFLANMSHEIRTPMTAILGFTDELIEEQWGRRHAMDMLATVKSNGVYLIALIDDILDLSKVEAGKMSIERVSCSPCQIVDDVRTLMDVRARGKGLMLAVEYVGPIPETIETDPIRLRQILVNLIGNAVKFTLKGEVRIVVRLDRTAAGPVMQFDVVDTGIGMSAEQLGRIFLPFSQADTSTTRKFGGTGLGLTICKKLSALLGGDISVVETKENAGTRFRATIQTGSLAGVKMVDDRAPRNVAPPATHPAAARPSDLSGYRILLAEDCPDNQRLVAFVLRKSGAEVVVAENGKLAVQSATDALDRDTPFDVILMDMQMPIMDGYHATRRLRANGYTLPIIALTAHTMSDDRRKCVEAGCDDYATKPIDKAQLTAMVCRHANPSAELSPT